MATSETHEHHKRAKKTTRIGQHGRTDGISNKCSEREDNASKEGEKTDLF